MALQSTQEGIVVFVGMPRGRRRNGQRNRTDSADSARCVLLLARMRPTIPLGVRVSASTAVLNCPADAISGLRSSQAEWPPGASPKQSLHRRRLHHARLRCTRLPLRGAPPHRINAHGTTDIDRLTCLRRQPPTAGPHRRTMASPPPLRRRVTGSNPLVPNKIRRPHRQPRANRHHRKPKRPPAPDAT